jgi:5-methylcytosine-specific restriction endonuclease McrA
MTTTRNPNTKPRILKRPQSKKGLDKALAKFGGVCARCKFEPEHPVQLKFDHIDGNPMNSSDDNIQLLCGNCHDLKTLLHQDYLAEDKKPFWRSGRPYPVFPWRKEPLTNFHGNQHLYGTC